jgi:hypothetical protein
MNFCSHLYFYCSPCGPPPFGFPGPLKSRSAGVSGDDPLTQYQWGGCPVGRYHLSHFEILADRIVPGVRNISFSLATVPPFLSILGQDFLNLLPNPRQSYPSDRTSRPNLTKIITGICDDFFLHRARTESAHSRACGIPSSSVR